MRHFVLPDQTGHAGDVLNTDGQNPFWGPGGGGGGIISINGSVVAAQTIAAGAGISVVSIGGTTTITNTGGGIGGTLLANQIAFGTALNTIGGDNNHTIDDVTGFVLLQSVTGVGQLSSFQQNNNLGGLGASGSANLFSLNTVGDPILSVNGVGTFGGGRSSALMATRNSVTNDSASVITQVDAAGVPNLNANVIIGGTSVGSLDITSLHNELFFTAGAVNTGFALTSNIITATANSQVLLTNNAGASTALFNMSNHNISLGDITSAANSTRFILNDLTQHYTFNKLNFTIGTVPYVFPAAQAGAANDLLTNDGAGNLAWTPLSAIAFPITVNNVTSLFSTGMTGTWNSTATNSIILGANAGNNVTGTVDGSVFIGTDAGNGSTNATDSFFFGTGAGQTATDAAYSNFFGTGAGKLATVADNSQFFGQSAGLSATYAGFSQFIGTTAGDSAANACDSIFIGTQSGFHDTVNNLGVITYILSTGTFRGGTVILGGTSGATAVVAHDNGAGTVTLQRTIGTFILGETISGNIPPFFTAQVVTFTPSKTSILIGENTSTGGFSDSVAIGKGATNTAINQFMIAGSITNAVIPYLGGGGTQLVTTSNTGVLGVTPLVTTANEWHTTGNAGLVYGVNFLGTTDACDLQFRVASQIAGFIQQIPFNTSLGQNAGQTITTGTQITLLGYRAGVNNTSGNQNTFLGASAGFFVTTGSGNTMVGYLTGNTGTTGGNNTILGATSDVAAAGTTNAIALGFGATAATNEFALPASITNWKFQGASYTLPTAFPATTGSVLSSTNAGVMTWVLPTTLAASTYTPALTNVTNVTASTPHISSYSRVGSVVTVFGSLDVTTTLAVATEVDISLPIASALVVTTDANGLGSAVSAIATNIYADADTVNDRVRLKFIGLSVGGSGTIFFSFNYNVI